MAPLTSKIYTESIEQAPFTSVSVCPSMSYDPG